MTTGTPRRSWSLGVVVVVLGLMVAACSSSHDEVSGPPVPDDRHTTLIEDPTILVQNPQALEFAGLEPGPQWEQLEPGELNRQLAVVFERGHGDEFWILKQAIIPTAVVVGLEAGDGDPSVLGDLYWLGAIDGRISVAIDATRYRPPDVAPTVEEVEAVIGPSFVALVAESLGVDTDTIDIARIHAAMTVPSAEDWPETDEERWEAKDRAPLTFKLAALHALNTEDRLDLAPDLTIDDASATQGILLDQTPILDSLGDPLVIDGTPVTYQDWSPYILGILDGSSGTATTP